MSNLKKPGYDMAHEARMQQLAGSIKSDHRGAPPSRDPEVELRPAKDSVQLGEGSRK